METFFTKDVVDQLLNYPFLVVLIVMIWIHNKTMIRILEMVEKISMELKK